MGPSPPPSRRAPSPFSAEQEGEASDNRRMAIDTILIQLADVTAKIDNVRTLLDDRHPTLVLSDEDRNHINALLGRLNEKKAQLEGELRRLAKPD